MGVTARGPTARKALALLLAAAVLAAAPARLVVDAGADEGRTHLERTHDPARCGYLHDHAACQQLFASGAVPAPGGAVSRSLPPAPNRSTFRSSVRPGRRALSPALPRAPPHLGS